MRLFFITFFLIVASSFSYSMDIVGGFISWRNNGNGRYIVRLTLYRDCNGPDMQNLNETIKLWNHPNVSDIQVSFIYRNSLTPTCSQVSGSPSPLSCGSGDSGGNSIGTIEEIVYESSPIDIDGKPPVEGWTLTYEITNRKGSITNLIEPSTYGMTLSATLFESSPVQTNCLDNSPILINPFDFIACVNNLYEYMPYYQDIDMDILKVHTSTPLKNISSGAYEYGVNPPYVDFVNGLNSTIPIPGSFVTLDNVDLTVNENFGDISFKTNTIGEYVVKFTVDSYRNGKRNASIDYEFTIFVKDCTTGLNNPPTTNIPFVTGFETYITAGNSVNFNITATDEENLQDGSSQFIKSFVYSPMLGQNYTNPNVGCLIVPCATLNADISQPNQHTKSIDFNWQTTCDHLKTLSGIEFDTLQYQFLYVFSDNYCDVPKKTYKRVLINVTTNVEVEPAKIDCIQTLATGELLIQRSEPINPNSVPVNYELHSIQNGFITMMPLNTYTYVSNGAVENFFIKSISGNPCSVALVGDTVQNIVCSISANPDFSVAILNWNSPYPNGNAPEGYYSIMREYPVGTWTEIAQVQYGNTFYYDTVDICHAFLNYSVFFNKIGCSFNSNIIGENLQDGNIPNLPKILSVSINPVTGLTEIIWEVNSKPDTYGYIIYQRDENNFSVEIDTAYGRTNTVNDYDLETDIGAMTFSVAAFDSCLTDLGTFYATTGKCPEHTTMFLTNTYDICNREVKLNWTPYIGWSSIFEYRVLIQEENGDLTYIGSTNDTNYTVSVNELKNYKFVILAIHPSQTLSSYSNISSRFTTAPTKPTFHYTKKVSVENSKNELTHYIEQSTGVKEIIVQKKISAIDFEEKQRIAVNSDNILYRDEDSEPTFSNSTYRVIYIDSCGNYSDTSNVSTTILLSVDKNSEEMITQLSWTPYIGFAGTILYYNIYRGKDNIFDNVPLSQVTSNHKFYYDTLPPNYNFDGNICYYVEAVESMNKYMFQEKTKSNIACTTLEPIFFIPNSFTPNQDGINEEFSVKVNIQQLDFFQLTIMNRWGEIIFQSQDQNTGWNGSINNTKESCPEGSYLYILQIKDGDSQEISKNGFVNLLR